MYITDRHDRTFAVKVALNPNTTNQPIIIFYQSEFGNFLKFRDKCQKLWIITEIYGQTATRPWGCLSVQLTPKVDQSQPVSLLECPCPAREITLNPFNFGLTLFYHTILTFNNPAKAPF